MERRYWDMTSILRALGVPVEGGEVCPVLWIHPACRLLMVKSIFVASFFVAVLILHDLPSANCKRCWFVLWLTIKM